MTPPTFSSDEEMTPLIAPDSAGREGPLPELVKCAKYRAEIAYIAQRARVPQEQGISLHEMASSTGLNGWESGHLLSYRGRASQWPGSTKTLAVAALICYIPASS